MTGRHLLGTTAMAAVLAFGLGAAPASAAGELKIYNWFDYTPQELVDAFSEKYDVDVTIDTYDSNETLLARLKAGVTGYDVAMPGDYMVAILIQEGMLAKAEPNKMENFGNVDPQWVDVYFDPGREYSVPWQWGTTSFMVDTEAYDGDIDTLAILFDTPEPLQGKINMLKDVNDVLNAGLRYLDHPRCNDNPEQLKALNDLLVDSKGDWLSFNSDGAKEVLVSGDAEVGMIWNGFGMRAREEKGSLKYAYPKEGLTAWMDNVVVLKDAPNMENAKLFMNFMMDPKNAATLSNFARYANGISGSAEFMDPALQDAYELNPPEGAPTPEFVPPCNEEVVRFYDRIWTNLLK